MKNRQDETAQKGYYNGHPSACTRSDCTKARLQGTQPIPMVTRQVLSSRIFDRRDRSKPVRNRRVTYTILTAIAVIFAIIAGLSTTAWLLPLCFVASAIF